MANKAISELPQAQNVNNQDLFVLEQSGIAKKLTAETFITEQGIIDALAEALDGHGGIQSVTLSSVSGRIRTYLITFTDGTSTTFQVLDGNTIDRIAKTSTAGLTDTYTVFMSDGTTTFFTVTNGADGNVSEAMLNDALKDKAPAVTETTESSAIANFTDGADDLVMHHVVAEINPVQSGSGDPSPSNIRPISGWTGCNVTRVGTNLIAPFNESTRTNKGITYIFSSSGISITGTSTESNADSFNMIVNNNLVLKAGRTYYFRIQGAGVTPTLRLFLRGSQNENLWFGDTTTGEWIVVPDSDILVERIMFRVRQANATVNVSGHFYCTLDSNVDDYESYQGDTYDITFPSEAGTVYGGTIDVATGLLTVDRAIVTLGGGLQWQTWGVNRWTQGITGFYLYRRTVSSVDYSNYRLATLTNMLPINSLIWGGDAVGYYSNLQASAERDWYEMLGVPNDSVGIVDTDTNEQALSKFNAFLTATPLQVVHMLATPQTYQLTPQQIMTLLGTNNVWADTGDVTVTYTADTKMFIEKLTMPTEDDLVANQAITSGKYFMIGNSLYLALANIASGAQITIGTNAQRVSLADALNTINS